MKTRKIKPKLVKKMSEIRTKEYEKPENIITPNSKFSIEVENLRKVFTAKKGYDDIIAVDNVSFKVKTGELFGFLGPNGAGKTTTINMLIGLIKPSSGTAIVNGYDVKDALYHIKQLIGVCPQEPAVFKQLTGKDIDLNNLRRKLIDAEESAIISKKITKINDNPYITWNFNSHARAITP